MNLLNGFINKGSDESLLKSLFCSGLLKSNNLVPKKVLVNGPHGQYWAIRNVSPDSSDSTSSKKYPKEKPKEENKPSLRSKFKDEVLGKTTSLGTKISSFDEAHFFKRVHERHPKPKDISDALINPQFTRKGKNEQGSTEYWGKKFVVVVIDNGKQSGEGQVKTCYKTNSSQLNRNLSDIMRQGG